jgi:serine/threonine protein kinase
MQLLGKSLENMFTFCNKKFSVRCVCNLGYQMVEILKYIHDKHIIHQDIKPDNFVTSYGENKNNIYLLDFGLARKYRSSTTLKHYPKLEKKKLTGTARYASIHALNGTTQSRRDDLESVGYVLMYFLRGNLPWQGLVVKNKNDKYAAIKEKKISTTANELCKGFPKEFEEYVNYTRNLDYEDEPDYNYLKNLFLNVLKSIGYKFDYYCDWSEDVNLIKNESKYTNYNNNYTTNNNNSMINNENSNMGSKRNSRYVIIPEKRTNENITNSMFKNQEKTTKGNYYESIYNTNKNLSTLKRKRSSIEYKFHNEQNQNIIKIDEDEENNSNKNNNNEKQNSQNNKNNKNNTDINNKNNNNFNYVNNNDNNNKKPKKEKDNNCCLIF